MSAANTAVDNGGGVFLLDKFTSDTLKGGAKKPELAKVLCEKGGAGEEWLTAVVNLVMSLVARLGGHSAPRSFPSGLLNLNSFIRQRECLETSKTCCSRPILKL